MLRIFFKNYYGRILDETNLTKEDILMLFFIAIAGPVKQNENKLYSDMKKLYGKTIGEEDTIEHLYSLELVDWFKNEITKIADQSFGNYILYYVLFEKRWVSVESLISIGFPRFRKKIVYALNTVIEIFNSQECAKYMKDSIIAAWENAPVGQEKEYLESFCRVNPDKALSIIKNHIDQEASVNFDLCSFDINSKKNYHNILTKEIEILGAYKYTENYEDAIDLLMWYFKKRPDLIMDFYLVLSERLLYDKHSYKYKYNHETRLIDKLWFYTENGKNHNNSILYLQIAESALKTERSFTEEVRNSRAINFVRMTIGFTEEIADMRTHIWKNLAVLRNNEDYRDIINDILLNVHFNGLSKEDSKKYLQSDFNAIYGYVIDRNTPDFFDAKVVARYKEVAEQIGIKPDQRFMVAERNPEFRIYRMLTQIGRTIDGNERLCKESISKETRAYDLKNFCELFRACRFLEKKVYDRNLWSISTGLDFVFETIEDDSELYLKVLEEYLKVNAPFSLNGERQIKYMLNHIGYEATYRFVINYSFDQRDAWLSCIWESIPEENINEKIVMDYKSFILTNLMKDNPIIPTFQVMTLYAERDSELKSEVIKAIVANLELSANFLEYVHQGEYIEMILNFFRHDMVSLTSIYINALSVSNYFDYDGKLFIKIFEQHPTIWNEYVRWIKAKDSTSQDGNEHNIFELIWNVDNWSECVGYAFKILMDEKLFYIRESVGLLFAKSADESVFERKKSWLVKKLRENSLDFEKCKNFIDVVVNFISDWKLAYILEFLKTNNNPENFKKINLFPLSESWSGSEIPLIMEKIAFLRILKDNLKGIDYIDHRKYLEDYCMKLEEYKAEVELREYLENADYS